MVTIQDSDTLRKGEFISGIKKTRILSKQSAGPLAAGVWVAEPDALY